MEKNIENLKIAYDKGYRVIDGNVISPNGLQLSLHFVGNRPRFKIRNGRKMVNIYVSRLAGYQKFGEKLFQENIHLYHINGNPSDNSKSNLKLGTFSDAQMSKDENIRLLASINATESVRKHNHEDIIDMRNKGMTYEQIMKVTGIKSKGTISFICAKSISAKSK
jgi:hypothetical protein